MLGSHKVIIMGWARGSEIMNNIIHAVQPHVKDHDALKAIYIPIIKALDDSDWDTHDESMDIDPAFDEAMREVNPDEFEEDWDE